MPCGDSAERSGRKVVSEGADPGFSRAGACVRNDDPTARDRDDPGRAWAGCFQRIAPAGVAGLANVLYPDRMKSHRREREYL